jgi:hypothetical protein
MNGLPSLSLHGDVSVMTAATQNRRAPLGLFADKPWPRLYDRIIEVLRVRRYSRRTEDACVHWIRCFVEFLAQARRRAQEVREISFDPES